MSEAARAIRALFPESVVALTAAEDAGSEPAALLPEEAACIVRAGAKRRREFAAGRSTARLALARLGVEGFPLLADADRVPRWPEGVVGSISHCAGCCAVVVARRGRILSLGLDVERADPLEDEILTRICTPRERERAARQAPPAGIDWGKLVFSAKESAYKCYFPLARTLLGFQDMEIDFSPDATRFSARLLREGAPDAGGARRFEGRAAWTRELVFAGVVLEAQPR
ncbi:MAG TPA: 4'-phosphopantetheinyl transferase superfamily protein [Myxococcota bacterium]|jgi:4'-phosphopantetheinyl transferase EntD